MEARMKQYRQVSPERAKVWTEKSPRYYQNRKVPVVYYLCRNRQLEHPHFIEVPVSSPEGLFMRDVIQRLNILRGRGIASMYSWSCKRTYKNGFVWQDLCEDDLILPCNGNEYVLKGSELFDESNSDHFSPVTNINVQTLKQLPAPKSYRSQDDSSSSSSMNGKETKISQEDEQSSPLHPRCSASVSPDFRDGKNSPSIESLSLTEYKVYKKDGLADASTQTEENTSRGKTRDTCTRGVSTDDGSLDNNCNGACQNKSSRTKHNPGTQTDSVSPPAASSSASSYRGKNETLESLIRADVSKMNSFRILEKEDIRIPVNVRAKATNMLMQLISCGSISVKDHQSFGLIPTYKPRLSSLKFPSPYFSTSMILGDLDCLADNPRLMGIRFEDKEYFSGSLIETKVLKERGDGAIALKRSSSYNADRTSKQLDSSADGDSATGRSKCIPLSIKTSLAKPSRNDPLKSPLSDKPRRSSEKSESFKSTPASTSSSSSRRITDPLLGDKQSKRLDSFVEDEKMIKIEERLASGARVIIQSMAPSDSY